jgi:hypothetical protein
MKHVSVLLFFQIIEYFFLGKNNQKCRIFSQNSYGKLVVLAVSRVFCQIEKSEICLVELVLDSHRTVRYTDIPKISVLNQYRYIDTGYSTIPKFPIYQHFSVYRVKFTNYMAKP